MMEDNTIEKSFTIRGTEDQKKRFDKISDLFPKKADAFEALLQAYQESKALADNESRVQMENVRGLCNNLCSAFERLLVSQSAELSAQKKEADLKALDLQEQLERRSRELSDALEQMNVLKEELERERNEKDILRESNTALKEQNQTQKAYMEMMKQKIAELETKEVKPETKKSK